MTAPTWAVEGTPCVVNFGSFSNPTFLDGQVVRTTPTQIVVSAGSRTFRFSRADGVAYGNPRGTLHQGTEADVILARRRSAAERALRDAMNLAEASLYGHRHKAAYIADPEKALRALIEQASVALAALSVAPDVAP